MPRRTRSPTGRGKSRMLSFRCGEELARAVARGAAECGVTTSDFIVLCLRIVNELHGIPPALAEGLLREREKLGMNGFEHYHFVHFMRALEVRRRGPGFDLPVSDRRHLGIGRHKGG